MESMILILEPTHKAFHTIASKTPENISNKDFDDVVNCSIRPVQRGKKSTPHSDKFVQNIVRKKKFMMLALFQKS